MSIQVLFFGITADVVGKRELAFEIEDGSVVGNVIEQLQREHPALTKHKLLVALNEEYVSADTALNDGDTLAVFTAVSGG